MRSPCGEKRMHSAPVRMVTPSAARMSRIASETSGSSRPARRGPFSTTVTAEPRRRKAWANSRPIGPPPTTTRCSGSVSRASSELLVRVRDPIDPGKRRDRRAGADIEEDLLGPQPAVADRDLARPGQPGLPGDQGDFRSGAEPILLPLSAIDHDCFDAGADLGEVDGDRPGQDAEVGSAPREMCGIGAGDQRLGRTAAGIDAGAAEVATLDQRHLAARAREADGERRPGLAAADDDGVEFLGHASATATRASRMAAASSRRAAGRSRPNDAARRPRTSAPPSVPMTAPIKPATSPTRLAPPAAPSAAPQSAAREQPRAKLRRDLAGRRGRAAGR